jgi:hypothetical protein
MAMGRNLSLKRFSAILIHCLVAIGITTFLFFIDERNFNFNWAADPGCWLVFCFYAGIMVLTQTFCYKILLRKSHNENKITLASVIGVPLGWLFTYLLILCIFHFG